MSTRLPSAPSTPRKSTTASPSIGSRVIKALQQASPTKGSRLVDEEMACLEDYDLTAEETATPKARRGPSFKEDAVTDVATLPNLTPSRLFSAPPGRPPISPAAAYRLKPSNALSASPRVPTSRNDLFQTVSKSGDQEELFVTVDEESDHDVPVIAVKKRKERNENERILANERRVDQLLKDFKKVLSRVDVLERACGAKDDKIERLQAAIKPLPDLVKEMKLTKSAWSESNKLERMRQQVNSQELNRRRELGLSTTPEETNTVLAVGEFVVASQKWVDQIPSNSNGPTNFYVALLTFWCTFLPTLHHVRATRALVLASFVNYASSYYVLLALSKIGKATKGVAVTTWSFFGPYLRSIFDYLFQRREKMSSFSSSLRMDRVDYGSIKLSNDKSIALLAATNDLDVDPILPANEAGKEIVEETKDHEAELLARATYPLTLRDLRWTEKDYLFAPRGFFLLVLGLYLVFLMVHGGGPSLDAWRDVPAVLERLGWPSDTVTSLSRAVYTMGTISLY